MIKINLIVAVFAMTLASSLFSNVAQAGANFKLPIIFGKPAPASIYNKYCTGDNTSAAIPGVNYNDPDVQAAVKALSVVKDVSYYFYRPVISSYGLIDANKGYKAPPPVPDAIKDYIRPATHALLVQTCGEFRDRPTMVREKFEWYKRLVKLPIDLQQPIDPDKDLWPQVTAHSYHPFLSFQSSVYEGKVNSMRIANATKITLGTEKDVDAAVEAVTMCETKFMFANYIAKEKYLKDPVAYAAIEQAIASDSNAYNAYLAEYDKFRAAHCVKPLVDGDPNSTEQDYVYDYRGDKNFKHNSPEANGMIWTATSITAHCKGPNHDPDEQISAKDKEACDRYFKNPFAMRWNTGRAALGTWILHSAKSDIQFENPTTSVTLIQHLQGFDRPLDYSLDGSTKLSTLDPANLLDTYKNEEHWHLADFGFNQIVGINGGKTKYDQTLHYKRLRDAVNRHSNWYNSAFDDEMGWTMSQVYSPLVASSHQMSASNGFAGGSDGRLAWMFVFRVKKANCYNTNSVLKGQPVDFNTQWFDETSLGTAIGAYTKSERAFDRLGTALEGEFDSILYLHNLTYGAVSDDSLPDKEEEQLDPANAAQEVEEAPPAAN